jgi:hypothetical protein
VNFSAVAGAGIYGEENDVSGIRTSGAGTAGRVSGRRCGNLLLFFLCTCPAMRGTKIMKAPIAKVKSKAKLKIVVRFILFSKNIRMKTEQGERIRGACGKMYRDISVQFH